ncbi:MAG: UDP-N-acetylmuramoyl-tripeptide--D-alanyl-D-alanine ligase [Candidatus Dormibacteria bacterium]
MADHPLTPLSFRLYELVEATGGQLPGGAPDVILDRLVVDSRDAGPGALFVALSGEVADGHQYISDAARAGATAILCRRPVEGVSVPQVVVADTREALVDFTRTRLAAQRCRVVGITGSVGKTTTKEFTAAVLGRRYEVLKTPGNLNTYTGFPMTVAGLDPRQGVFVAEFGMSAAGEIALLARMAPPDVAVVLNVGLSHVGLLGSIEAIARAKQELVDALSDSGTAVLNADDARVAAMASACRGRVLYFSLEQAVEVRAEGIELGGLAGSAFTLVMPEGRSRVQIQVPGLHAVSNALAAAAAGMVLGVGPEEAAQALESCRPPAGRMALRMGREGATVIDDSYNASPSSMLASLRVLLAEQGRRRIAVLGDMLELGEQATDAHHAVGRAAAGADLLVAVGNYAAALRAGALEAGMPPGRALVAETPEVAASSVEPFLEGALVLVKASRGMALERVVEALVGDA